MGNTLENVVGMAKNENERFYIVNVLYAAPILRGNAFVLEDFPMVNDCGIKVKVEEKVKKVVLVPQGKTLDFEEVEEGYVRIQPFDFSVHQAVAIYY